MTTNFKETKIKVYVLTENQELVRRKSWAINDEYFDIHIRSEHGSDAGFLSYVIHEADETNNIFHDSILMIEEGYRFERVEDRINAESLKARFNFGKNCQLVYFNTRTVESALAVAVEKWYQKNVIDYIKSFDETVLMSECVMKIKEYTNSKKSAQIYASIGKRHAILNIVNSNRFRQEVAIQLVKRLRLEAINDFTLTNMFEAVEEHIDMVYESCNTQEKLNIMITKIKNIIIKGLGTDESLDEAFEEMIRTVLSNEFIKKCEEDHVNMKCATDLADIICYLRDITGSLRYYGVCYLAGYDKYMVKRHQQEIEDFTKIINRSIFRISMNYLGPRGVDLITLYNISR